jgi:hypothetical protein
MDTFNNILNDVILKILGIATVRWVIAHMGWFPKDKKFSWLVYDKYDSGVISETLRKIGLTVADVQNHISLIKIPTDATMLDKIICLCINNIIDFQEEIQYGHKSPVRSRYYINSMESSYYSNEREIMAQGILNLCATHLGLIPDFIITPKNGNPHLSYAISEEKKNIHMIVVKSTQEGSYVSQGGEINYEGITALVKDIKENPDKIFFGIAVDCNASGCGGLKNIISRFNEEIQNKYQRNIEAINKAVILFRPDSDNNIDDNNDPITIFRYFDLDEEIKMDFSELRKKSKKLLYNDKKYNNDIKNVIRKMQDKRLIKFEEYIS